MAGKSRKHVASQGHFNGTEAILADGPKGHMELKSSAFAPTDCKLVSQYLVLDHMAAHYRKVNHAKSAIDSSAPKGWNISQKVRDRVRREASRQDHSQSPQTARPYVGRPAVAMSEVDRMQMISMMKGLTGEHVSDNTRTSTCMQRTRSMLDKSDMDLINRIVSDTKKSPSHEAWTSREPRTTTMTHVRPGDMPMTSRLIRTGSGASTPRDGDLLNMQAHLFTDEKPFVPRTLRTNRTSKLTEFKYYNPPKRRSTKPVERPTPEPVVRVRDKALRSQRVMTPMTMDSTDLMNETLRSRDMIHVPTPSGVPPLNISLDADHMLWIKEHAKKTPHWREAHNDSTNKRNSLTKSRGTPGIDSKSAEQNEPTTDASLTMRQVQIQEEELRYLAFVTDVTNDVLDRGIFTNRALKKIFECHIEKRKNELKVSKMREMLDDLRMDLGIPANNDLDGEGIGTRSTHSWSSHRVIDTRPQANGSPLAGRGHCHDERKEDGQPKRRERKPPLPVSRAASSQSLHHHVVEESTKRAQDDAIVSHSNSVIPADARHTNSKEIDERIMVRDKVAVNHDDIFDELVPSVKADILHVEPCTDVGNLEADVSALKVAEDLCEETEVTEVEKPAGIFNNNKDEKRDALEDVGDYTTYLQEKDDDDGNDYDDDTMTEVLPGNSNKDQNMTHTDLMSTVDIKNDTIANGNTDAEPDDVFQSELEITMHKGDDDSGANSIGSTPRDMIPTPAPRKLSRQYSVDTPKSLEQSSDSLQISDIDEDDF